MFMVINIPSLFMHNLKKFSALFVNIFTQFVQKEILNKDCFYATFFLKLKTINNNLLKKKAIQKVRKID